MAENNDEVPCGDDKLQEEAPDAKKMRERTPERASIPQASATASGQPMMVPPSPPKFISMEEILKAAEGVSNMALAHEIAVDDNFALQKMENDNQMQKQVKEIMHKAFWDSLKEKLNEDPPDYSQAITLLEEVKTILLELLMPHQNRFKQRINDSLDMDLIKQKVEHNTFEMKEYSDFVISVMEKFCAPARDADVAGLKSHTDIVVLFKDIFRVLDLLKLDMANFTIQQMRPIIQQHSIEYEKGKFEKLLAQQTEMNLDGLLDTKAWLARAAEKLKSQEQVNESNPASSRESDDVLAQKKINSAIINQAYLDTLDWDEKWPVPETLLMDHDRLYILQERMKRLTLICSVILITQNTVGAAISGIKDFKERLRETIMIILADVPRSEVPNKIDNVTDQIIVEVNKCLSQHGFQELNDERQSLLRGQITEVASTDHPVHKLLNARLNAFILQLMSKTNPQGTQLPPGVSVVAQDLSELCGQFLRIINHNIAVYGSYYGDICSSLNHAT